jgi:hypothetical protein
MPCALTPAETRIAAAIPALRHAQKQIREARRLARIGIAARNKTDLLIKIAALLDDALDEAEAL